MDPNPAPAFTVAAVRRLLGSSRIKPDGESPHGVKSMGILGHLLSFLNVPVVMGAPLLVKDTFS